MMEIRVEHAGKILHGNRVLDDINFSMHGGTVYGFWGTNGSGKTMLMRLITGLIKPNEGSIYIDGRELGKHLDFPPRTGALIENPAFLDGYTGKRNLELLADIQGIVTTAEIELALLRVGLNPEDKRKYHKYSLGMKQRLGVAAAIMEKPSLLILDEPMNALDREGIEQVKEIIKEEKDRGALVVLACHDRDILEELSDVIFTVDGGRIIESSYYANINGVRQCMA